MEIYSTMDITGFSRSSSERVLQITLWIRAQSTRAADVPSRTPPMLHRSTLSAHLREPFPLLSSCSPRTTYRRKYHLNLLPPASVVAVAAAAAAPATAMTPGRHKWLALDAPSYVEKEKDRQLYTNEIH